MTLVIRLLLLCLALCLPRGTKAQTPQRVTIDNFFRAESESYFATYVAQGALGRFFHLRDVTRRDKQDVVRMNRDTLYPLAILDLYAGPATEEIARYGRSLHVTAAD